MSVAETCEKLEKDLRRDLFSRKIPANTRLPSEPTLVKQYHICRATVRKVLKNLEDEGLIRRVRGSGTYPAPIQKYSYDRTCPPARKRHRLVLFLSFSSIFSEKTFRHMQNCVPMFDYFSKILKQANCELLFVHIGLDNTPPLCLKNHEVDGIIFHGIVEKNFWETWMKHLPCVGLHYPDPELSCNWVALDDRCRSHMAVSYLYSLGHRRIGFLSNECGEYVSRLRYQGFLDALRYFSLPCREEWQCLWQRPRINGELLLEPPFEVPDYEPHLRKVFQKTDFPTALVCLDDWRAYCANAALKKMGFSIPEDVSLIGGACTESQFTSDISFTRMIDQVDNICEEAAKLLLDVMHSPPGTPPKTWLLRPRLVTGKTTAPPRRDSEGNPLHTHRKDNQ